MGTLHSDAYWLNGRGSILGKEKEDLFPLRSFQTGSGAHPATYPIHTAQGYKAQRTCS
jgi:hypothetical protein